MSTVMLERETAGPGAALLPLNADLQRFIEAHEQEQLRRFWAIQEQRLLQSGLLSPELAEELGE